MIIYITVLNDGTTNHAGEVPVEVNLSSNETYQTHWSPEKLKLEQFILALRNTAGNLLASELDSIVNDYGESKYREGYEEAEYQANYK